MTKRISPAALHALREALTVIFWYKKDLRRFLIGTIQNTTILARLNWSGYKRDTATQLVDMLSSDQDRFQDDLLGLMEEVMRMEDFSHLRAVDDDGPAKEQQAASAVEALRKHAGRYAELQKERENAAARRAKAAAEREASSGVAQRRNELRQRYLEILDLQPQARGFALEKFLPELFNLYDLDPRASFRVVGEQIDGAFVFDNLDYLLEAKWWDEYIPAKELDSFSAKVGRKLDNTLGLFLSISGFSPDGIAAYSGQRSLIICMDGADLMAVLDGRIDLDVLLRRKRKRAAQRGQIYVSIGELLS